MYIDPNCLTNSYLDYFLSVGYRKQSGDAGMCPLTHAIDIKKE